jgi:biopolymer transport protein ExbB
MLTDKRTRQLHMLAVFTVIAALLAVFAVRPTALAQAPAGEDAAGPTAVPSEPSESSGEPAGQPSGAPNTVASGGEGINIFKLLYEGGVLMIPILLMSFLVVTFVIERFIALRRTRVIPDELVESLGQLGGPKGGFDPRKAYRLCQQYPSAAANVIRSMLLKVGRPHSEVEHAVAEAAEREADRIYANVRWLNLASAVSPLLGLFGTVWGMIRAFHDTTALPAGVNKADFLAEGIYIALVTTLGGLAVAIPAAIFAHYFEGRITALFHEVDELLFNLMPQIERYEGRVRFSHTGDGAPVGDGAAEAASDESRLAAVAPK